MQLGTRDNVGESEPACEHCGRLASDFACGVIGLKCHIPQCKKRWAPQTHKTHDDTRGPSAEKRNEVAVEPSCEHCGRTAADFAGGKQGLKSHIPQCKDKQAAATGSDKRKAYSSPAAQPAKRARDEQKDLAKLGAADHPLPAR